jgi:hypothetical protein
MRVLKGLIYEVFELSIDYLAETHTYKDINGKEKKGNFRSENNHKRELKNKIESFIKDNNTGLQVINNNEIEEYIDTLQGDFIAHSLPQYLEDEREEFIKDCCININKKDLHNESPIMKEINGNIIFNYYQGFILNTLLNKEVL